MKAYITELGLVKGRRGGITSVGLKRLLEKDICIINSRFDHCNESNFTHIPSYRILQFLWLVLKIISLITSQGTVVLWKATEIIMHSIIYSVWLHFCKCPGAAQCLRASLCFKISLTSLCTSVRCKIISYPFLFPC